MAKLRDAGAVLTAPDPGDRRRTLVRPAEGMLEKGLRHARVPVDETIAAAIGAEAHERLPEALMGLELLGQLITPLVHRRAHPELADTT